MHRCRVAPWAALVLRSMGKSPLVVVVWLLAICHLQAQSPRVFVDAAQRPPLSTATTLDESAEHLRQGLRARGFTVVDSLADADVTARVLARRQRQAARIRASSRVAAEGNAPVVTLVRVELTVGSDQHEIRGKADGEDTGVWQRAADAAAKAIAAQLGGKPRPVDVAVTAAPDAGPAIALTTVLERAANYVSRYQQQFAAVLADEDYLQVFTERRFRYPAPITIQRRRLQSELALAWFPELAGWFGFRDVDAVDGRPVPDREYRVGELIRDGRGGLPIQRAVAESARFNLGTVERNFNVPMVPLLFLASAWQHRFDFEIEPVQPRGGTPTAIVIHFTERLAPTVIQQNGASVSSRGRFWIDPRDGQVLRTELSVGEGGVDVRIGVWYQRNAALDMLVPARMREVYDYTGVVDDFIEATATYSNYRRFETESRILGRPVSSPPR